MKVNLMLATLIAVFSNTTPFYVDAGRRLYDDFVPKCRSSVCDDRPRCPPTACTCIYPSKVYCDVYYICIIGKPQQYRCSPGLLLNPKTLTCDYSSNVNCSNTLSSVLPTDADLTASEISTNPVATKNTRISVIYTALTDKSDETVITAASTSTTATKDSQNISTEELEYTSSSEIVTRETVVAENITEVPSYSTNSEISTTIDTADISKVTSTKKQIDEGSTETSTLETTETSAATTFMPTPSTTTIAVPTNTPTYRTIKSSPATKTPTYSTKNILTTITFPEKPIINRTTDAPENTVTTEIQTTETDVVSEIKSTTVFKIPDTTVEEETTTEIIKTVSFSAVPVTSFATNIFPTSASKPHEWPKTSTATKTLISSEITDVPTETTVVSTHHSTTTEKEHLTVTEPIKSTTATVDLSTPPTNTIPSTEFSTTFLTQTDILKTTITDELLKNSTTTVIPAVTSIFKTTIMPTSITEVSREVTNNGTENTKVEQTTSQFEFNFSCPSYYGLFPDPTNCKKFYHCSHFVAYHKLCPSNLHFNKELLVCDWPYRAGCQLPTGPTPVTSITVSSTMSKPLILSNETCECDSCVLPLSDDCSKYILCINHEAFEMSCQEGLLFNQETDTCDLPENVVCEPQKICTQPIGRFALSGSCSYFVDCKNEDIIIQKCPDGLYYDDVKKTCGWNGTCTGFSSSPTPKAVNQSICTCEFCFQPVEGTCSEYVLCLPNQALHIECDEDLFFNPEKKVCDYDYDSSCSKTSPAPLPACPKTFGYFPDPDDCRSYIHCLGSRSEKKECPEGLFFNSKKQHCDWPWSSDCGDPNSSPEPSSAIMSCDCQACTLPKNDSCSNFIICVNFTGILRSCSPGLLFNPNTGNCDLEENVTCEVITKNSLCPEPDGFYPYPEDCDKYIRCSGGSPEIEKCPSSLHFNSEKKVCDWSDLAGCEGDSLVKPTKVPEALGNCSCDCCLMPDEQDCSKYYLCANSVLYEGWCSHGLLFNSKIENCDVADKVQCETLSPFCTEINGLFPDPKDCSSFYYCANGKSYLQHCPTGLHFNMSSKLCEDQCLAKCDQTLDCSSLTSTSVTYPSLCKEPNGLNINPDDCGSFYMCSDGRPYLVLCPTGLHFNPEFEICEKPCDAGCDNSTECKSQSTTTPPHLPNQCLEPDGLFPNADDCRSFYNCSKGLAILHLCPEGQHFSTYDKRCVPPCVAGCNISNVCPDEKPHIHGICSCDNCFFSDPTDCSAFYHCQNEQLTKSYCPYGKLFNQLIGNCSDEEIVTCEPTADPVMCINPVGVFVYPGDCRKLVYCQDNVAFIMSCPPNHKFNPDSKSCEIFEGKCNNTTTDSHCISSTGLFADVENCSLFYQCDHGVAYLKECPSGLFFNPYKELCDWPDNVACEDASEINRTFTTQREQSLSTITQKSSSSGWKNASVDSSTFIPTTEPCQVVPGVICPCACRVPTYDNCNTFYQCQEDGTACKKSCPEGLYFNKAEMVCDLPQNIECRDFYFTMLRKYPSQ